MVQIAVAGKPIEVGRLDKVMYPVSGFTKGDVLRYYQAISPVMLPHLAHHPVMVKRCPDGVEGMSFYEKRCPAKRPSWVASTRVASKEHGTIDFCMIDSAATLMWMANRAAIEYHTYLYRGGRETEPTMMIFDLDPGPPATLLDCLDIALIIRDLLAELGLEAFAKTSGGKGMHLGVPLRGATFPEIKAFARSIADLLAGREPKRVTSLMAKDLRRGRVFIDWSQNDHGKTTACAYTLRAQPRPTVSTPVAWEEIQRARRRGRPELLIFEADQVLRRVGELGDLFAPTLALRQRLPRLSADRPGGKRSDGNHRSR